MASHGVTPHEAEDVVRQARRPWPLHRADDKWLVWGPGLGDRFLQVVFVIDEDDSIYIIHARPLTKGERKRYRRGQE